MVEPMDDYINSFAPELQAIIRTLREVAKKSMPDAHEMVEVHNTGDHFRFVFL